MALTGAGIFFTPPSDKLLRAIRKADVAAAAKPVPSAASAETPVPQRHIDSHLYALTVTTHGLPGPIERGALTIFENQVLISNRAGTLFRLDARSGAMTKLPLTVPIDLSYPSLSKFEAKTLSVLDIEIVGPTSRPRLYASYLFHEPERDCIRIALSAIDIIPDAAGGITGAGDWQTIYRTNPCIAVGLLANGALYGAGGRIEELQGKILLSIGSLALDGLDKDPIVSQDPGNDYGKILLVTPETQRAEIFTTGHRNPQGLALLSDGTIISSEHGPRGGDEVNLIVRGENYGWPLVTYGTRVYYRDWPVGKAFARHDGFRKPLFAFAPSVGTSELIEVRDNPQFPLWNGNVLLTTLLARTLMRMNVEDGRVTYVEPIELGHRLRDIASLPDGSLALLTDDDRLLVVRNNDAATQGRIGTPSQ